MKTIHINIWNKDKKNKICLVSARLGIKVKDIKYSDYGRTIGEIAGIPFVKKRQPVVVPPLYSCPDLLIFNGFSSEELDEFLAEYKKAGIEPTKLKAVVTPFNATWPLIQLIENLKAESREKRQHFLG